MADYKILTIPFGRDAVPDMVNDIPSDPIVAEPQRASFKQGFPSITTIPLVAGGIPPEGQDFNGILRDITEHIVHQNKGGMYKFAPEVVAAGGYPKGAVLSANDDLSLWVSLQNNNVQDFNTGTPTQWARIAFSGLDALLNTKADKAVSINAGTGLTGGGNLSANRTLSVSYGTTEGTAAQGNDSRLSDAREWSAETVSQAEAEAGTATTRRAWTAQRVRQAIVAWWNGVSSAWGRGFVASADAAAGRTALELGNAAVANVQSSPTDTTAGALMAVGAGGWMGRASENSYIVGFPQSIANNISQVYRRADIDNGVPAFSASFHIAASDTWGRLRVGFQTSQAWIQGGVANGSGWTAELYHTGNVSSFAQTLLDDANASAARATLDVYSKAEANGIAIGVGQTWQNVTASRSINTTYTNTTGRPIMVSVRSSVDDGYSQLTVDGVVLAISGNTVGTGNNQHTVCAIVPNGASYSYSGSAIALWAELR
jgi:hypothetical protein